MAGVAERTLALKLIGDVSGLRKDLKPAQRQIGQFTKGLASWGKALAGGVLIGGVERLAGALGDAWDGYRSGEKAAAQLRKTWKNLGLEGKRYRSVLDKVTASTLELGTSDDEAVEAFGRSLNRTRDYKQSLRELSIAQDLVASGAATNLESAFRLIQQAGTGSARVVDRFGLKSKTAAGRIRELGDQVKGTAKAKAKLDPLGVLFNRLAEDSEAIVGAFAKGDFKGVVSGLQGLGETVADALFGGKGKDNIRNSKTAGLVNQFGGWASKVAKSIQTEFGKVDWAKTLSDTLNSAIATLTTAGANGTLSTLATIGAGIAGAIFAVDLFLTAAKVMFKAPGWLLGGAVDLAARAVGTALGKAASGAMWLVSRFTSAAKLVFAGAEWLIGGAVNTAAKMVGTALGKAASGAMWLVSRFTSAARTLLLMVASNERVLAAAHALGSGIGVKLAAGIVAGITLYGPIQDFINQFLPESPFDRWMKENKRASGGPVSKGRPYLVGERGPEMFVPGSSGGIIPNHRLAMATAGAGAGSGSTINITVNGYVGSEDQLGRVINRHLAAFVQRGGRLGYR